MQVLVLHDASTAFYHMDICMELVEIGLAMALFVSFLTAILSSSGRGNGRLEWNRLVAP